MVGGLTGRMLVASGLLAILVGSAFVVLLLAITDLRGATDVRRQTREQLVAAEGLEKLVIDLETGVRGFVITGEKRFLEPWSHARALMPQTAAELERLAAVDPTQLARVRRIVEDITAYIDEYTVPLVRAIRRGDAAAHSVETTDAGKQRVDALRANFNSFREAGRARLSTREAKADAAARRATVAAAVGIGGSILLILAFTGYLTRVIVQPLRRAARMSDQLAGGDLSARMREGDVGEIGALERSFNVMAGSLEKNRDDLAGLLAEQAALRKVATLVAEGAPPAEVFAAVAEEVGRLMSIHDTRILRYEADGTATVIAGWSERTEVPPELEIGARVPLDGKSVTSLVYRTGQPARVADYGDATGPLASALRGAGVQSAAGAPIVVEGRLWGVMAVGSLQGRMAAPGTEARLAQFTELVATAIGNAENRAELTASRARIVSAADETRRRIERDLHDGTQQRLVSLGLELRLAQADMPTAIPGLKRNIGRLADELDGVIDDLREISRGIHPAILAEGGLSPALRTLARRAAIPVELDLQADGRFPEQVEVAAYYVVSETLTNAARYAGASLVNVALEKADGTLQLSIRDDGVGGADPTRGSGLIGLRDRVQALGGSIEVTSPVGEGTLIVVGLPVQDRR